MYDDFQFFAGACAFVAAAVALYGSVLDAGSRKTRNLYRLALILTLIATIGFGLPAIIRYL